jgi:transaldolase
MRIFLDTANLAETQWALSVGLIDGVTTNPSLLAGELFDGDRTGHVTELCRMAHGPVTVQVLSVAADDMYREGKDLARIADNLVVEIPMIEEGLIATRRLVAEGVRVNMTLVFSVAQALLAAKAGADFVSPFVGRLDDVGSDGGALVADMRRIFDQAGLECEIIASSIRTARRFVDVVRGGAHAVTVPPAVLRSLILHPLTDIGMDQFLNDWSKRITRTRASV